MSDEWPSQPWANTTAYMLDPVIAQRIKELRCGPVKHSWRMIAIKVTGFEDQHTGMELCRLAQWTLGEEWEHD